MTASSSKADVLAADAAFFAALLSRDIGALERLLAPDFLIVDVARGGIAPRAAFIALVMEGAVRFDAIDTDPADAIVRRYGDAAVVIGATAMRFRMPDGGVIASRSRYTHVFVCCDRAWRLASAQGTPIADD